MFQGFLSPVSVGDGIYFSECGKVCACVDAVSRCDNPQKAKDLVLEFLKTLDLKTNNKLDLKQILLKINEIIVKNKLFVSVCILQTNDKQISLASCGNSMLLEIEKTANFVLEPLHQPLSVLGEKTPFIESKTFTQKDNAFYILATDGINLQNANKDTVRGLKTTLEWTDFAQKNKTEDDWCFVIFPFGSNANFETPDINNLPYDPFVGEQEWRKHEQTGLIKLAAELFKDSDFYGFKILGNIRFEQKNSFRDLDGLLVSPFGIVLLELKDYEGDIFIDRQNGKDKVVAQTNKRTKTDKSPIETLHEALKNIDQIDYLRSIDLQRKNIGACIFTHSNCTLKIPSKTGNILCAKPQDFPSLLKAYWQKDLNIKNKKARISQEAINEIVKAYKGVKKQPRVQTQIIKGSHSSYELGQKDTKLSNQIYSLYKAKDIDKNKFVWIKEYIFENNIKDTQDLQRESKALVELRTKLAQGYIDSFINQDALYLVLEYIEGVNLEDFLKTNPSRALKLEIINHLAYALDELKEAGIIHRNLNPKSIIIRQNKPVLTNFELCKMDSLATIVPNKRQELDLVYLAPEVNTAASSTLTNKADIYSLGLLIVLILSGNLPFKDRTQKINLAKKDKAWRANLAKLCALDEFGLFFERILSNDATKRPDIDEILEVVKQWS